MPDKLTAGALAWTANLEPLGLEPSLEYKNAFEANLKHDDSVKPSPPRARAPAAKSTKVSKAPKTK